MPASYFFPTLKGLYILGMLAVESYRNLVSRSSVLVTREQEDKDHEDTEPPASISETNTQSTTASHTQTPEPQATTADSGVLHSNVAPAVPTALPPFNMKEWEMWSGNIKNWELKASVQRFLLAYSELQIKTQQIMEKENKPQQPQININGPFTNNGTLSGDINNPTYYSSNGDSANEIDNKKMRENIEEYILPFVKSDKQMFALVKGLMHNHYIAEGDFKGAKVFLEQIFPEGLPHKVDVAELVRCNALSLSKDINEWREDDQLIGGTYPEYKTIADRTARYLPVMKPRQ